MGADVVLLIEKIGRLGTTILITLASVIFTQIIRFLILVLANNDTPDPGRISSFISPLILAPVFSWFFIGQLLKVNELEKQMRELAAYDSMTNLYNGGACLLALENTIRQIKRAQTDLIILYIDLDHFKDINDTYGHDIGDMVIKHFANFLKASLRESDIIGRIGGEEFLVGLPGLEAESGKIVAEKLRKGIANETITIDSKTTLQATISIGMSIYRHTEEINLREILKKADIALYDAKNNGRNRVCVH
jgi:diguanylate cyclase (GGDEF)-like protein